MVVDLVEQDVEFVSHQLPPLEPYEDRTSLHVGTNRQRGYGRLRPSLGKPLRSGPSGLASYGESGMRGATARSGLVDMRQSSIDFVAARRQVEALTEVPATVRARAFSIYVGLSELADDEGSVQTLAADLMSEFEINRGSWTTYRRVLEAASLISIERDGRARPVRLLPPAG